MVNGTKGERTQYGRPLIKIDVVGDQTSAHFIVSSEKYVVKFC